jgi:hypothetical protein
MSDTISSWIKGKQNSYYSAATRRYLANIQNEKGKAHVCRKVQTAVSSEIGNADSMAYGKDQV